MSLKKKLFSTAKEYLKDEKNREKAKQMADTAVNKAKQMKKK
ncbi:hypothetical protein [Salibacterium qingdaonense]|uniref:Uncharacterized protein n=1 Tax=Salibacterium qingdaonense TaxID=266892 RepID=A0A1I4QUQ6_9BACI|nr:hypothetical protein [Salibacterium qingdaonense]SFM43450.1 hypothetical protein SAMN04488054_1503 [Salibacterium qingdaonense]